MFTFFNRKKNRRRKTKELLSNRIKEHGLTQILQKDINNGRIEEEKISWFHGRLSREDAVSKLTQGTISVNHHINMHVGESHVQTFKIRDRS